MQLTAIVFVALSLMGPALGMSTGDVPSYITEMTVPMESEFETDQAQSTIPQLIPADTTDYVWGDSSTAYNETSLSNVEEDNVTTLSDAMTTELSYLTESDTGPVTSEPPAPTISNPASPSATDVSVGDGPTATDAAAASSSRPTADVTTQLVVEATTVRSYSTQSGTGPVTSGLPVTTISIPVSTSGPGVPTGDGPTAMHTAAASSSRPAAGVTTQLIVETTTVHSYSTQMFNTTLANTTNMTNTPNMTTALSPTTTLAHSGAVVTVHRCLVFLASTSLLALSIPVLRA